MFFFLIFRMRWQLAILFVSFVAECSGVPMKVINTWGSGADKWFEGECVVNVTKRQYIGQWTMKISLTEDTKELQVHTYIVHLYFVVFHFSELMFCELLTSSSGKYLVCISVIPYLVMSGNKLMLMYFFS